MDESASVTLDHMFRFGAEWALLLVIVPVGLDSHSFGTLNSLRAIPA